jgi:hypothetical protein
MLTLYVLIRVNWIKIYTVISDHPILMCSFIFSILFAFLIGLTTANFGALVRFKIPLVPLYVSTMMVLFSYAPKPAKRSRKVIFQQ